MRRDRTTTELPRRKTIAQPAGWTRTNVADRAARTATAAAMRRRDLRDIKKRAPRTGPSGYNVETDCLERPACAEADAANAGEARTSLQERRVRRQSARVAELALGIGRAWGVADATETSRPGAVGAKAVVADAGARRIDDVLTSRVGGQVEAVIQRGDPLLVEDVEHVEQKVQMRTAERDRVAEVDVSLVVRRTAAEGAARGQVVLPVAVSGMLVAVGGERKTGLPMRCKAEVQAFGERAGERVRAVELHDVRTVAAEQAVVVDEEVSVIERGVDVRIVLTGRVLEGTVVVALQARPHVAGEELIVVAETLLSVKLDAGVLALRLRSRSDEIGCVCIARNPIDEGRGRADAGARVGDEVLAGSRVEHVLDHAAEVTVGTLDADAEVGGHLVVVAEEVLVDVLTFEVRIDRGSRGVSEEGELTLRGKCRSGRVRNEVTRSRVKIRDLQRELAAERTQVDVHRNRLVETAEVRVDLAAAVVGGVEDDAEARREVVLQIDVEGVIETADLLLFPTNAEVEGQVRHDLPLVLQVKRSVLRLRAGDQRVEEVGRERRRIVLVQRRGTRVHIAFMDVIDETCRGALIVDDVNAALLADTVAAAFLVRIECEQLLFVATELDLVVAPEGADVEFAGVALEVLRLEEAETARVLGRAPCVVDGARNGRSGAVENVLLFVAAELSVDVPVRSEDAGVTADVVVATDFVDALPRARRTCQCEHGAREGRRVAQDGEVEELAGGEREAQFSSVQVALDLRRLASADGDRALGAAVDDQRGIDTRAEVGLADFVVGAEEPQAVLHDVAAAVDTVVELLIDRAERRRAGRQIGDGVIRIGVEAATAVVSEHIAMELVRTALGDGDDRAAGEAAVFGRKTAGQRVDFLNEVLVETLALEAFLNAGDVQAVDDVLVLTTGRTVNGRARGVGRGAGSDLRGGDEVAAQRQRVHRLRGDVRAGNVRRDVDHRSSARNRDLFRSGRAHSDFERDRLVQRNGDIVLRHGVEPRKGGRHRVQARRKQRETEVTAGIRHGAANALKG